MERVRSFFIPALAVACFAVFSTGCGDNPVGNICFIGADAGNPDQAIIAAPALECTSRTCLFTPLQGGASLPPDSEHAALCTAECSSDSDCDRVAGSPCQTGFTCAVPVVVGPFCCRNMCICKDYLVVPDEGLPRPAACDPENPDNRCCNLAGREDDPRCGG
jgi:hypothetical protein